MSMHDALTERSRERVDLAHDTTTITRFAGLYKTEATDEATDWPTLFEDFSRVRPFLGKADHPGWSPARFDPPLRELANVQDVSALVLDIDNKGPDGECVAEPITIEAMAAAMAGYHCHVHSTKNHTPDWPRFRVTVPFSRRVLRAEYAPIWQAAARRWPGLDPQPKDPSRFWYTPGIEDGGYFEAIELPGAPLDPDEWLAESAPAEPVLAPRSIINPSDRVERARAYIEKMPAAISGAGGHQSLWKVTRKIVCDFGLDEATALQVLREDYNPRCQPRWSEKDMLHKVRDATTKARVVNPMEDRPMPERDYPNEESGIHPSPQPEQTPPEQTRKLPFTWVRDFGPLMEPPTLRWLFKDLRTGKPFIRGGKCYAVTGDGGVGKGMETLQASCSIVTGTALFDTFEPMETGRVAILAAEDDTDEIWHRLARIVRAYDLDVETIREKIGIFPLSGEQVNLLRQDQNHNQERTQTFKDLVSQLTQEATAGGFEWSLVVMDPLARFGADNVEIDQGAATALVAALEHLAATVPGKPAVQLNHHSSSASVQSGRSNVRGVTGLRNAFRLVLTLDAFDTDSGIRGVLLRNDKNNLAPKADPLWLVRMENQAIGNGGYLDTAGVLRPANADEQAHLELVSGVNPTAKRAAKAEAKLTEKAENFEAEAEAILGCLPVEPETITRDQLCARMGALGRPCAPQTLKPRIQKLMDAGLMVDLGDGKQRSPRRYARPQTV